MGRRRVDKRLEGAEARTNVGCNTRKYYTEGEEVMQRFAGCAQYVQSVVVH